MNALARGLGTLLACAEHGLSPDALPFVEGVATKMASADAGAAGRLITKMAYEAMRISGQGYTAPAFHLHFISKQAHWDKHCQEVVDDVVRVVRVLQPLEKQAFSNLASGAGSLMRGVGYGSLGMGAGLGALYWLLSRHAQQDDADMEAKQKQIEYYNSLSRELNDSMRRKYQYSPQQQTQVA